MEAHTTAMPQIEGQYRLLPMAKNKLLLRLTNTADKFDQTSKKASQEYSVNLKQFATDLYKFANNDKKPQSVLIIETNLSGN